MSLRRGITQLLPRLLQHELAASSALPRNFSIPSDDKSGSSIHKRPSFGTFRCFASDSVAKTGPSSVVSASGLSMSFTSKITYAGSAGPKWFRWSPLVPLVPTGSAGPALRRSDM
eukprot:gene22246-29316_t